MCGGFECHGISTKPKHGRFCGCKPFFVKNIFTRYDFGPQHVWETHNGLLQEHSPRYAIIIDALISPFLFVCCNSFLFPGSIWYECSWKSKT